VPRQGRRSYPAAGPSPPSEPMPTLAPVTPIGYRLRWRILPAAARLVGPRAALLLPEADAGWRQAVLASHHETFAVAADDHGLTLEAYVAVAATKLREWAGGTVVRVRMDADDVASFVHDRRYRNQFVTGTSQGAYAPGRRMLVEHTVLGVPPAALGAHRPIYGYCSGSNETHPNVLKYGDAVLILRREVNHRTTFTFGDSLDETAILSAHPPFAPEPLARPTTLALDGRFDLVAADEPWEATSCGYIEAQIHGGLRRRRDRLHPQQ
jgi:hypothetical protein